jgi:hypothetical protein
LVLAAAIAPVAPAQAAEALLEAGVGAFGFRHFGPVPEAEVQLRGPALVWELQPQAGMLLNDHGGFYGWVGVAADVALSEHLRLVPAFGVGYYQRGTGMSLGYPLEFRSQIEIAWRFDDGMRLGVQGYHISNAGLGDINPGVEAVLMVVAMPL